MSLVNPRSQQVSLDRSPDVVKNQSVRFPLTVGDARLPARGQKSPLDSPRG